MDETVRLKTLVATKDHITLVRDLLNIMVEELLTRGEKHDQSKLEDPELEMFATYTDKLSKTTYGSDEYKQYLKEMGPALQHHYSNNKHHPEHYVDGVAGMTLVDLMEMMVDWYASSKRHADGDIRKSIEHNQNRFGLTPQLTSILLNTAALLDEKRKGC